jgi:putative oxidoreductase
MQDLTGKWAPLAARVLIAAIFVWSGVGKMLNFEGTQGYMASKGMPLTAMFAVGAIAVELGGGLALAAGFWARRAAVALALFMVPTTLMFHGFWAYQGQEAAMQTIQFMKNLAIIGGLLMVASFGAGMASLDARRG